MGTVRRTQSFSGNSYVGARNLSKSQLGGVIFGCTNDTLKECLFKQIFGLPSQHISYVKNIYPGLPLFLFNYSDRKLHGIFEAVSDGQMSINPYAWTNDGTMRTQYPAQVQVCVRMQCKPQLEEHFKPIILENYYHQNRFWFELDHGQTNKLKFLFESSVIPPSSSPHQNTSKWRNIFHLPSSTVRQDEDEGIRQLASEAKHINHSSRQLDSTSGVRQKDEWRNIFHVHSSTARQEEDEGIRPLASKANLINHSSGQLDSTNEVRLEDEGLMPSASRYDLNEKTVKQDERNLILMKLKELACKQQSQNLSLTDLRQMNEENPCSSSTCQHTIAQLIQGIEELKAFKEEQTGKMSYMEQKLAEAVTEIHWLKDRCMMLESNHSTENISEKTMEFSNQLDLDPTESIFLIGGYDGKSWLSVLESYFPSQDAINSLRPMDSVRSYASVAQLNNQLIVFGGGDGCGSWYDTVVSYSVSNSQWTIHPCLNEKKGSLAGANLHDKLYAIGGGNGFQSFSDVEMLDLDIGRWIQTRSMLQKRFALAAVELNGVLYATGGYDGNDYLKTAERFDPREHSWTKIASMNMKRGCHSLVVFNEKLYALGGYNGTTMVPSIEIYDPRANSWMSGDPMNQSRGYSAAAVVKDSIYVIGGLRAGEDIIDTVECYSEGQGWQEKVSKAIGKRCFLSAISL